MSFSTKVTMNGDVTGSNVAASVVAIQGNAVSSTAPSTGQFLEWNGTAWTPTGASVTNTIVTVGSGTYTVPSTNYTVLVNGTGITVKLPNPAVAGTLCTVKDTSGSAESNNITIAQYASENIENVATSKILQTNFGVFTFVSDGTNWWIVDVSGAQVTTKVANYSVPGTGYTILVNGSGITITLPNPATAGTTCTVKDISGSAEANNITIARYASEYIENISTSKLLQTNFGAFSFVSDGTNWWME